MPNKDRPLVDRHAPKNGVSWLMNDQEGRDAWLRPAAFASLAIRAEHRCGWRWLACWLAPQGSNAAQQSSPQGQGCR